MITHLTLSDIKALRQISITTFTETFAKHNTEADMQDYVSNSLSEATLRSEMEKEGSRFYAFVEEGTWCGYLKVNCTDSFELERIYVLQAHQGKGIGKLLMDFAIQEAKNAGFEKLWLGVWEHNHKAIAFYESLGFIPFGEHDFLLGSDLQRDVLYALPFKKS